MYPLCKDVSEETSELDTPLSQMKTFVKVSVLFWNELQKRYLPVVSTRVYYSGSNHNLFNRKEVLYWKQESINVQRKLPVYLIRGFVLYPVFVKEKTSTETTLLSRIWKDYGTYHTPPRPDTGPYLHVRRQTWPRQVSGHRKRTTRDA